MTNQPTLMNEDQVSKRELLLKEYELCENFASQTAGVYWQITALFLPVALGSLVLVIQIDLSQMKPIEQQVAAILIGIGCITFVIMLLFWMTALERALWYQHIAYYRAREIEDVLGLRKNSYIRALDNWHTLTEPEKKRYEHVYADLIEVWGKRPPTKVRQFVPLMGWVGILAWILVAAAKIFQARAWEIGNVLFHSTP